MQNELIPAEGSHDEVAAAFEKQRRHASKKLGFFKEGSTRRAMRRAFDEGDFFRFEGLVAQAGAVAAACDWNWVVEYAGKARERIDFISALLVKNEPRWLSAMLDAGAGMLLPEVDKAVLAKRCVEGRLVDLAIRLVEAGADPLMEFSAMPPCKGDWKCVVKPSAGMRRDLLAYAVAHGDAELVDKIAASCQWRHGQGDPQASVSLDSALGFAVECEKSTKLAAFAPCVAILSAAVEPIRAAYLEARRFQCGLDAPSVPALAASVGGPSAAEGASGTEEFLKLALKEAASLRAQVEDLQERLAASEARADALANPASAPRFTRWRQGRVEEPGSSIGASSEPKPGM